MFKILIVLYMTLFTSFDMLIEKQVLYGTSHEEKTFSLSDQKATVGVALAAMIQESEDSQCPDPDHCPDCHECHLGHCGILVSPISVVLTLAEKITFQQLAKVYSSRGFNSVFRPPIEA